PTRPTLSPYTTLFRSVTLPLHAPARRGLARRRSLRRPDHRPPPATPPPAARLGLRLRPVVPPVWRQRASTSARSRSISSSIANTDRKSTRLNSSHVKI